MIPIGPDPTYGNGNETQINQGVSPKVIPALLLQLLQAHQGPQVFHGGGAVQPPPTQVFHGGGVPLPPQQIPNRLPSHQAPPPLTVLRLLSALHSHL
jgi:hypothetical protein